MDNVAIFFLWPCQTLGMAHKLHSHTTCLALVDTSRAPGAWWVACLWCKLCRSNFRHIAQQFKNFWRARRVSRFTLGYICSRLYYYTYSTRNKRKYPTHFSYSVASYIICAVVLANARVWKEKRFRVILIEEYVCEMALFFVPFAVLFIQSESVAWPQ